MNIMNERLRQRRIFPGDIVNILGQLKLMLLVM